MNSSAGLKRKMGSEMKNQEGFVEGLWYAIEQLVLSYDQPSIAEEMLIVSGIPELKFRKILNKTEYEVEALSKFLDKVFG